MFKGSYEDFFAALRQRESGGDYKIVNSFGFLGAYQFGEAALVDLGFVTNDGSPFDNQFNGTFSGKAGVFSAQDFLNDPDAQDLAATEWFSLLWSRIRAEDLEYYDGQTLNGIFLTKTGMIAASHLLGVGGLRDFIQSGGENAGQDGFGTSIVEYINLLGNYEAPESFLNNHDRDNILLGSAGEDIFFGHAGGDTLVGRAGDDILNGGAGHDIIDGAAGEDHLIGGAGDDLMDGGLHDDILEGGSGHNTLRGASGDDLFIISNGTNEIETGSGADIIQFEEMSGVATISDFQAGIDKIDLSNLPDQIWVADGRCVYASQLPDALHLVQMGEDVMLTILSNSSKEHFLNLNLDDALVIFEDMFVSDISLENDFIFG